MPNDLITRLDRWLSTKRADYYAKLRPGATPAQLDAFEQKFELKLPAEFRELYLWRDGNSGYDSFQFNRMFPMLSDITDSKDLLDGMIGTISRIPSGGVALGSLFCPTGVAIISASTSRRKTAALPAKSAFSITTPPAAPSNIPASTPG